MERRGLAAGIIFGGSGAGGAIFPLLINALLGRIGFRWTLRALALLFAAASAPAVYLCRPRLPITVPNPRRIRLFPSLRFAKQRLFLLNVSCAQIFISLLLAIADLISHVLDSLR